MGRSRELVEHWSFVTMPGASFAEECCGGDANLVVVDHPRSSIASLTDYVFLALVSSRFPGGLVPIGHCRFYGCGALVELDLSRMRLVGDASPLCARVTRLPLSQH
jgi:hypothetical protein